MDNNDLTLALLQIAAGRSGSAATADDLVSEVKTLLTLFDPSGESREDTPHTT